MTKEIRVLVRRGDVDHEMGGREVSAASLEQAYLASGRVVPAALKDNAFSFSAPTGQFPAKLVAYDSAAGAETDPLSASPTRSASARAGL
jgi:hypothetical protein